jgi:2-dehydropantoate 2-reductase
VRQTFAKADIALDVQDDIVHWLWVHDAAAIAFAAGFAKSRDFRTLLHDRSVLSTCFRGTRELLALCAARGVDLKAYPDVGYLGWPIWLNRLLMRFIYATNKSMQRFTAHAASPGSLRETRAMYDAMLRTADRLSVPVPNVRSLGVYLPPATTSQAA